MASPAINESQLERAIGANTLMNIRESIPPPPPSPSDIGVAVEVLLGFIPQPAPPRVETELLAKVAKAADGIEHPPETGEAATEGRRSARIKLRDAKTEEEGRDAAIEFLQSFTAADMLRLGFEKERIMGVDGTDKVDPHQVIDINTDDTPVLSDDRGKLNQENAEYIVPPYEEGKYVDFDYSKDIGTDAARKEMMDGFELRKLTEMAYALFGRTGIEMITKLYDRRHNNKAAAIRTFFEGFAGDQCVGALTSPARRFKPGKSLCWICGFVIPDPKTAKSGYKMECEHVFPIAQAVYFVDLYRGKGKTDPNSQSKLELEYDWSHRVCNQIKNNKHFIKATGGPGNKEWIIADDSEFSAFLQEIRSKSGLYFKGERNLLEDDIVDHDRRNGNGQWLAESINRVRNRCVETLNVGTGGIYAGIFDLIQVAKLLDMYDTEVPIRKQLNDALLLKNPERSRTVPPNVRRTEAPAAAAASTTRAISAPPAVQAPAPYDVYKKAYGVEKGRQRAISRMIDANAAGESAAFAQARAAAAVCAAKLDLLRAANPAAVSAAIANAIAESNAAPTPRGRPREDPDEDVRFFEREVSKEVDDEERQALIAASPPAAKKFKAASRSRKNRSVVTRSMASRAARRTKRNAK